MRPLFIRFLLGRFAVIFLFVLAALTSLLVLFDVLAHSEDLTVNHASVLTPMACYAVLRLPTLATMIIPLAVLLAALVAYERLAVQSEIVALGSAGISLYRVVAVFLGGALVVCALQFLLTLTTVVTTEVRLDRWAARSYRGLPDASTLETGVAWFASGPHLIRFANAREQGRVLDRVTVVERGPDGTMVGHYEAATARFTGTGWELSQISHTTLDTAVTATIARQVFRWDFVPRQVALVGLPVDALPLPMLHELATDPSGRMERPAHYYETWWHRRWAEPLASLTMMLLAAPLGLQLKRGGRHVFWGGIALGSGLLFFVLERIFVAFGESGALPPVLAIWSPLTVFTLLGLGLLIHVQK